MSEALTSRIDRGIRTAQVGLLVNATLAVIKVVAGVLGNAYALVADGIESGADIFSSLIVWRGLTVAARGASDEYHFGYGKAESLAAATVSLMLLGAGIGISIAGVREIMTPHHAPAPFTLVVLILVILVKETLFRRVFAVGESVDSLAVKSDAWHHRSDAITSLAAFVGITVALIGGAGWEASDDYAALVCAAVIIFNGVRLLRESIEDLMDRAPDPEVLASIRKAALSVAGVEDVEKILAKKIGLGYFVGMHVHADPNLTLHAAHVLSGKVKSAVKGEVAGVEGVLVHMEPTSRDSI